MLPFYIKLLKPKLKVQIGGENTIEIIYISQSHGIHITHGMFFSHT